MDTIFLLNINFVVYCTIFFISLIKNFNFNIILVGLTYLAPIIPLDIACDNIERFIIVSYCNLIFGAIELIFFVLTEKSEDSIFNNTYFQQLLGHVMPIVIALVGMSFFSRASGAPVQLLEVIMITLLFLFGSILRICAIAQLGVLRFKFNIAFREKQTLKTDGLHGLTRHPTYTAMMLVVFSYAITTHSWVAGILGVFSAWFGFQFRIYFEELALKEQFGKEYEVYRAKTPMWIPFLF
jgi:protein-S-isoprenylcysteine O-methyltransferase Ste14